MYGIARTDSWRKDRSQLTVSVQDRKMLWGRSASLCAICRCQLIRDSEFGRSTIIGEEAHIVAREPEGPRGESPLTTAQRDSYSNLLLLCPTDHTVIDALPTGPLEFPVEHLLRIKRDHEQWVLKNNKIDQSRQRNEEKWAQIVDQFSEKMQWDTWGNDIGYILAPGLGPCLTHEVHARLGSVTKWIYSRIWPPGHQRLRALIEHCAIVINDLLLLFDQDCEECPYRKHTLSLRKRHKKYEGEEPRYSALLADYLYRRDLMYDLVLEATRYSNAICDEIRQEIDPGWRFEEGAVTICNGPTMNMTYETLRPGFRSADFDKHPQPYVSLDAFKTDRFSRDIFLSDRTGQDYLKPEL